MSADAPAERGPAVSKLVHIVDDVPELDGLDELTLVVSLHGFLDAGNAAVSAADHLETVSDGAPGAGKVVATFDVDQFHDYRARRPAMSFVQDHYEQYDAPRLLVRLHHDSADTPFLLLRGPEPDNRWEAFCAAVIAVVERFGVTRVVGIGAVPMAVPHTRPIAVTPHASRPELLTGESPWRGELRIPSSAQALLEVRLGEAGPRLPRLRRARAALPGPARLPAGRARAARGARAGRPDHRRPDRAARRGRGAGDRDRPLPGGQQRGRRGRGRPRAAVRHLPGGRVLRVQPAGRGPAAARPARRSGSSSSSSWPASRRTERVSASAAELRALLDLEEIDTDLYRGQQPETDRQRVFGGQVAAQALLAAARSRRPVVRPATRCTPTSCAPGDTAVPIVYDVERLRDGRSFATRRVVARQHGRPIYFQTANFQRAEDGLEHQDVMPEVIPPEQSFDLVDLIRSRSERGAATFAKEWSALELRYVGTSALGLEPDPRHPAQSRVWVRVRGAPVRRPARAPRGVHLRQRPDPARRGAGAARAGLHLARPPGRLAGPHRLVPPAVPGRRVVALRPVVADARPAAAASAWPGSSPRTAPWSPPSPRRA